MKKVVLILKLFLFYVIFIIVGHTISGYIGREGYNVLSPDAQLQLGEKNITVAALAENYMPEILLEDKHRSPALARLTYEVVDDEETYGIVYHVEWEDEDHPDASIDRLYKAYRYMMYGLTLRDIEYIQLNVSKEDGTIHKLMFETPKKGRKFNDAEQEHLVFSIERHANGSFTKQIKDQSGGLIEEEANYAFSASQKRIPILVATWNHLMKLKPSDVNNVNALSYELAYLDDKSFKALKMVRRSQGDYATEESNANSYIIFIVGLLPLLYFLAIITKYDRIKTDPEFAEMAK